MKRSFVFLAALFAVLVFAGCQRDQIVYPTSNYYLEVDMSGISDQLEKGSLWQVLFYDATTKMKVYETYITPLLHPEDKPTGAYITGLQAGDYDIVLFNRDTRVTVFHYGDASDKIYAYAPNAGYSDGTPIVYEPDELYVYSSRVKVPYVSGDDVCYIKTYPKPILDTREFVVNGIKNLDIAENIFLYLSRQDRGSWLCPVAQLKEKSILVAEGETRHVNATKAQDSVCIWTPVSTFGAVDGSSGQKILLTVAIEGPNGAHYFGQADVTDQFLAGEKVIYVNMEIDVQPLEQGGFDPKATPWDVFITSIDLS